jgi:hypothetical protein
MKCSDTRFLLAADPSSGDAALLEHIGHCSQCSAYADDMRELDRRLRLAMEVPAPAARPQPEPWAAVDTAPGTAPAGGAVTRRFALAASVAALAVLVGTLWTAFPRASLASAVVEHMAEEPYAWQETSVLPDPEIAQVMARSGVQLDAGFADITYAQSCWFRGHHVPHLVVQTPDGPVTILVLPRERIARRASFDEGGYRGALVPAGRGAIAVLARDGADVDLVATSALAAIRYLQ